MNLNVINIYKVGTKVQNFANYHSWCPFIRENKGKSQIDERTKIWSLVLLPACVCGQSVSRVRLIGTP